MTNTIPDTNDVTVALIAVAWEIVKSAAFEESKSSDAKWNTEKFDEVYKQLLAAIQTR